MEGAVGFGWTNITLTQNKEKTKVIFDKKLCQKELAS